MLEIINYFFSNTSPLDFCAAIAAASAAYVAFLAFRSSTDPEVIVYPDIDPTAGNIIFLVIKNIGNGPAYDISFQPSHPIPYKAFGISKLERELKYQTFGPLAEGIPFLAPQQEIKLIWGQYGGLLEATEGNTISVTATYNRKVTHINFKNKKSSSCSKLFIKQFEGTHAGNSSYEKKISDSLDKIAQHQNDIKNSLRLINGKIRKRNVNSGFRPPHP